MNSKLKRFKSRAMFTIVGGVIIINPAFAQTPAQDDATTLDTVVVTGMRSSLDQSMNLKRDTPGIVDAISAEDIGKFPDTNLAESLQRITGISIERRDGDGYRTALARADGEPGIRPPWRSDGISGSLGVPPPDAAIQHTALGDAEWALAIYDHITGGWEKP